MKRILSILAATLAPALAVAAAPVKEADLPPIFKNEPAYVQNRICGELLAVTARMSANLYAASRAPGVREAAVMEGTRAVLFIDGTATLTDEEEARAKRIAAQLEPTASSAKPIMTPYVFCEERAQRWQKEGVVAPEAVKAAEADVRAALDRAVAPAKTR
jgi:hypothetical protein